MAALFIALFIEIRGPIEAGDRLEDQSDIIYLIL